MFKPPGTCNSASSTTGKSAVAGMDATTCTIGWRTVARRRFVPINTPTGMVQIKVIASATLTRTKVATIPFPSSAHVEVGSATNRAAAR